MRILITNDDGFEAEGIKALTRVAQQLKGGGHELWVVAPATDGSGMAHCLTFNHPLRVTQREAHRYALSGTPGDCVGFALNHLMKDGLPDLVLSGVNHGWNVSEDVLYSGTVGAAMEAYLCGIDAIALSAFVHYGANKQADFSLVERFAPALIDRLLLTRGDEPLFLNVNFPEGVEGEVEGVRVTNQGLGSRRMVKVEHRLDARGKDYYWFGFNPYASTNQKGTDLEAVREQYISVTPLQAYLTDAPEKRKLETQLAGLDLKS